MSVFSRYQSGQHLAKEADFLSGTILRNTRVIALVKTNLRAAPTELLRLAPVGAREEPGAPIEADR